MTIVGGVAPGAVYVQPEMPPVPPEIDPGRYAVSLTLVPEDPALSSFRLTDDGVDNGIILLGGMRGLGKPEYVDFTEDFAGRDGTYFFGERALPREVFLPLHVYHDGDSLEWLEHDRELFKLFRRGRYFWLVAQLPTGEIRRLRVRYRSGGDYALDRDPIFFGWMTYGLYFQADQPMWEGEPITQPWAQVPQLPLFGASNPGPPVNISPRNIATATITNSGDNETWPIWELEGPMDPGAELTVGTGTITVPFGLLEDDSLVIDTRPEEQTAILNGTVDKTRDLGSYGYREIPPGEDVQIGIDIPGTSGIVRVSIWPTYERAW